MDIQANTKLFDLLKVYPQLEEKIINIAPPFKNLKNPILRNTVGKLATIEKMAQIGKIEVADLINTLRKEVGQPEITTRVTYSAQWKEGEPEWIKMEPEHKIDGSEMLSRGEQPLKKVNDLMHNLEKNDFVLLRTDFNPIPLIDEMKKQKYTVFSKNDEANPEAYYTYIRKTLIQEVDCCRK